MKRRAKVGSVAQAKAALRRRLDDIFLGATGAVWDSSSDGPDPIEFMAFVRAVRAAFRIRPGEGRSSPGNEYLWSLHALENYRNPQAATEYLFVNDVRA